MKKYWLLIGYWFVCYFASAQRVDSAYIQCRYNSLVIRDSIAKKGFNDMMVLNIGRSSSVFYNEWGMERLRVRDSLSAKGASLREILETLQKYPKAAQCYTLFKNYPQTGRLTFTDKLFSSFFQYSEALEKPQWTVYPEQKSILGHTCQKAKTRFRGRTWTVWFAADIPVSDGPWKLWGLPGLILNARDSDNLFVFKCVDIKQLPVGVPILKEKRNYAKCSLQKYLEMEYLCSTDPDEYMFRTTGFRGKSFEADGSPMHRKRVFYPIELPEKK